MAQKFAPTKRYADFLVAHLKRTGEERLRAEMDPSLQPILPNGAGGFPLTDRFFDVMPVFWPVTLPGMYSRDPNVSSRAMTSPDPARTAICRYVMDRIPSPQQMSTHAAFHEMPKAQLVDESGPVTTPNLSGPAPISRGLAQHPSVPAPIPGGLAQRPSGPPTIPRGLGQRQSGPSFTLSRNQAMQVLGQRCAHCHDPSSPKAIRKAMDLWRTSPSQEPTGDLRQQLALAIERGGMPADVPGYAQTAEGQALIRWLKR
jgi:hypothetical protein